MSQYAQDSDTEDSDDDVDTSLYNVETGLCNLNAVESSNRGKKSPTFTCPCHVTVLN